MNTLLVILIVLFIALFILVKLTEKYGKPMNNQEQSKLSRYLVPLIMIMLIAQLINYWME